MESRSKSFVEIVEEQAGFCKRKRVLLPAKGPVNPVPARTTEKDDHMTDTVSWNLQLSVRDGQLENARVLMNEMVNATLEEPGTLSYEWYLGAEGDTCHINERYADSAAALAHIANFGANFAARFMACFEPTSFAVYGNPTEDVRAALAEMGVSYLEWFGGFDRQRV